MAKLRLYHGTAHDFSAFDDRFVMRGQEPNSALGIHLTESVGTAAEYAELSARGDAHAGTPRVLVVIAEIGKAAVVSSADDFLGRELDAPFDPECMRSREEFVAARHELETSGFHAVAVDSPIVDIAGTWTVFDPARIEIVGTMTVEEALDREPEDLDWDEVEMVSVSLFDGDPDVSPA